MIRHVVLAGWLVVLSLLSATALAQSPPPIRLDQHIQGTASSGGGAFHAFAATHATRVRLVLSLPDAFGAVALYDTAGVEIAWVDGYGEVTLSHTLPADGIYLVGITSATPGVAYGLTLTGQEPRITYVYDDESGPGPGLEDAVIVAASAEPESAEPAAAAEKTAPEAMRSGPLQPAEPAEATQMDAGARSSPEADQPDPAVWGVYARLIGRRTVPRAGSYQLAWHWNRPGEEIREEWHNSQGKVAGTIAIRPTGQAGQLRLHSAMLGGKEWIGRIGDGGQVTYVGVGLLKLPFVVDVSDEGMYRSRRAKVDDAGRPISIQPADMRSQWPLSPEEG
ncbi:hypothetical protein [Luteimonas saliphila]|uniref:hypothetical protein n=1 Tax=Luteimonas saliphila TaxID=2804919 RepID=UPI00192DBF6F|nr:hypothetical protein [Luteimonas saliphila]